MIYRHVKIGSLGLTISWKIPIGQPWCVEPSKLACVSGTIKPAASFGNVAWKWVSRQMGFVARWVESQRTNSQNFIVVFVRAPLLPSELWPCMLIRYMDIYRWPNFLHLAQNVGHAGRDIIVALDLFIILCIATGMWPDFVKFFLRWAKSKLYS